MVKKKVKSEKVLHPCRFLKDCECTHPEMEMYSEHCLDPESKEYYQIPEREDCVSCLLANLLVRTGFDTSTAFLKI